MMNKKPLKNNKVKILFLLLIFTTISCKSQITILSDINYLKSTHKIVNSNLEDILDCMLTDIEFSNWQKNENKLLIISSIKSKNEILVRAITLYRNELFIKDVPNNYSAYFMYKNVFVVYYGDESIFLKPTKNTIISNLFKMTNEDEKAGTNIIKINHPEYYGAQFSILESKLSLNEKNWFGSLLIESN